LALELASQLAATIIHCDDFFNATIPDYVWDTCTVEQKCRWCIDWQCMRKEALLPLLAGERAQYHPFSFANLRKAHFERIVN
jgi:uridine kinase